MAETMGKIIKALRRQRSLTQEELAAAIGVTAQAVSKWENDTGMPDISQVVPLAGVFGVHTDVLFGLDPQGAEAAVRKAAALEKQEKLDAGRSVELWADLVRQYPRCADARYRLAGAYLKRGQPGDDGKAAEQFESILDETTDEELRYKCLDMLCFCYHRMGDDESAVQTAKRCPPFHINSQSLLAKIDGYEKRNEVNKELLFLCLREICWCVRRMTYEQDGERRATLDRARKTLDLFKDDDERVARLYDELNATAMQMKLK